MAKEDQIKTPRLEREKIKEDRKRMAPGKKKRHYRCTARKRNLMLAIYRKTGGNLTALAKAAKISRRRMYEIFEDFPDFRREIDDIEAAILEDLKELALEKLEENMKAGLQKAIEYILEKEPRKERGRIVINRDKSKALETELWLGVRQKVIIE